MAIREDVPQGYNRTFLRCRALGHSWGHLSDLVRNPTMAWVRGLASVCQGCGTVRTRWLSGDGARWGSTYNYPDGYALKRAKANDGRVVGLAPTVQAWRQTFVSNLDFGDTVIPPAPRRKQRRPARSSHK